MSEKKRDEQLAQIILARHLDAANAIQPRQDEWLKARKRYEPQYIDRNKVRTLIWEEGVWDGCDDDY